MNTNIQYGQPQFQQYNTPLPQQNNQQPQNGSIFSGIKSDAMVGGGINGVISAFQKPTGEVLKDSPKLARLATVGANIATGGLAAIPSSVVNAAGSKMSNALADHYASTDKHFNTTHAALIAVPATAAGVYGLGAIMHGLQKGKDIMNSKSKKEAGKHLLDALNPVKHVKSGISETKTAFKDLFSLTKKGLGKRGLGALNLLGIAATAIPAVYSYYHKEKSKENPALHNLGYADDIINAAGAAASETAGAAMVKSAAYFPVITPLLRHREAVGEMSRLIEEEKNGFRVGKSMEEVQKKAKKHLANVGYDLAGLGVVGAGGAFAWKKHQENKTNPFGY